MSINPDFRDLFAALNEADARYRVNTTYGDQPIEVIGRAHLIINKRATGRPQDALDADTLERG